VSLLLATLPGKLVSNANVVGDLEAISARRDQNVETLLLLRLPKGDEDDGDDDGRKSPLSSQPHNASMPTSRLVFFRQRPQNKSCLSAVCLV